jgi:hypothetical protein
MLNTFSRYTDNATLDSVAWRLTDWNDVVLSYVDENEQSWFQFPLIAGSLLFGAGLSGIYEWLKEWDKKRRKIPAWWSE